MRLKEIRIQNFRSFLDETIPLDNYNCLVGSNGAGKSNVLQALNVFFRNTAVANVNVVTLCEEDFHHRNTSEPIKITLTFGDLSAEAREDFKAYVRSDQLVITATAEWDPAAGEAGVKQYGARLVIEDFAPYFEAVEAQAKATELKAIFRDLRDQFDELPDVSTKDDMQSALRDFEEAHPDGCTLLESESQFYGWSKGQNRLRKYVQWIYVPAVKDAATEQEEGRATALGQLLDRTVRSRVSFGNELAELKNDAAERYQQVLNRQQEALNDLSDSLTQRVREWTHLGTELRLAWHYNPDKSITVHEPLARIAAGEDKFLGEMARLGHGLQRSIFISLLQELAESDEENAPILLLGFEEPELYQHPPQARHVAQLLEELSQDKLQTILTTHSPYFVSARGFENVRMVRKSVTTPRSTVTRATHEQISADLARALGEEPRHPSSTMAAIEQIMQPSQNELFFSSTAILVEGLEDVAFLSTYLTLHGSWNEFRKLGCHFIVAEGKCNLSRPLVIANALGIPAFVFFDSDAERFREKPANHPRNNGCILKLCGIEGVDPMPTETQWADNCVMWHSDIQDVVRADFGAEVWDLAERAARDTAGYVDGVQRKNSLLIAATLEQLAQDGHTSAILDKACQAILAFAAGH